MRAGEGSASDEPEFGRPGSCSTDARWGRTDQQGSASDEPDATRGGSEADDEPAHHGQGASPRAMAAMPARVKPSRYVRMWSPAWFQMPSRTH